MVHILQDNLNKIIKNVGLKLIFDHKVEDYILDGYLEYEEKRFGFICKEDRKDINSILHEWNSKNSEMKLDKVIIFVYDVVFDDTYKIARKLDMTVLDKYSFDDMLEKSYQRKEDYRDEFLHIVLGVDTKRWTKEHQHKKEEEKKEKEKHEKEKRRQLEAKKRKKQEELKREQEELKDQYEKGIEFEVIENMDRQIGTDLASGLIQEKFKALEDEKKKLSSRLRKLLYITVIILTGILSSTFMFVIMIENADIIYKIGVFSVIASGSLVMILVAYFIARYAIINLNSNTIIEIEKEISNYQVDEQNFGR